MNMNEFYKFQMFALLIGSGLTFILSFSGIISTESNVLLLGVIAFIGMFCIFSALFINISSSFVDACSNTNLMLFVLILVNGSIGSKVFFNSMLGGSDIYNGIYLFIPVFVALISSVFMHVHVATKYKNSDE